MERHTSEDFVAFLGTIVASESRGKEIHIVLDNLSTHKSRRVQRFLLADHPKVHLHFTPTLSSWLNQVENWFSKIERGLIARGIFTSSAISLERSCVHQAPQRCSTADPVDVLKSGATHPRYQFNRCSPLGRHAVAS